MKYLLTIFIFLFICIELSAQASKDTSFYKGAKTKQDTVNVFITKRDSFLDSLYKKTSLKDFQLWLDENVSSKTMREGRLTDLWTLFTNFNLNEWLRKNKIVIPN